MVNRPVDSGITNILDDTVAFTNGTEVLYIRDLSLGNFENPIPPPPYLGTNYYSPPVTLATAELSFDGLNWYPADFSSEQVDGPISVTISNTTAAGTTSSFDTEMTQLTLYSTTAFGAIFLRESPTKQSLGKHTIAPDPRGYRISSFFDVFLEFSHDFNDWHPANRSIRLQPSMPPAVPGSIFASQIGTKVVVQWQNNFTLQSTTDLRLPFTDVEGPVTSGSYTNPITGNAMFFRLRN
jgi:hypothetical protein